MWLFTWFFFSSTCEDELIEDFFKVPLNCNFLEGQISVVLSHDPARDFFCSRWTSPPIKLKESLTLGWPITMELCPFVNADHPRQLAYCKMVTLVNILSCSKEIPSVNGRCHVIHHGLILRIFGAPKKLRFWQNHEVKSTKLRKLGWLCKGCR